MTSSTETLACVLDTDICIDYLRGQDYTKPLFASWTEKGLLAISVITQLEIFQGMRPNEESLTTEFLDSLVSIEVDVDVARLARRLLRGFRAQGITLSMGGTY